jgi:hypothetical protein
VTGAALTARSGNCLRGDLQRFSAFFERKREQLPLCYTKPVPLADSRAIGRRRAGWTALLELRAEYGQYNYRDGPLNRHGHGNENPSWCVAAAAADAARAACSWDQLRARPRAGSCWATAAWTSTRRGAALRSAALRPSCALSHAAAPRRARSVSPLVFDTYVERKRSRKR